MRYPVVTCASFSLQSSLRLQLVSLLSNAESNSFGCVTGLCFSIRVNAGMPLHDTPHTPPFLIGRKIETVLKSDSLMQRLIADNFR